MVDCPTGARNALDEAALDHASRQRAEGLVTLKGQLGKVVERGVGIPGQVAQGIPLDQADAQGGEPGIESSVVAGLKPLDGQSDLLEGSRHLSSIAPGYQLAYINGLI